MSNVMKLISGVKAFQESAYPAREGLFRKLASGQSPHTLFVTCSDSRIDPSLITQTAPGELFVIRNAGNLIPAHDAAAGGEAATVEYAVSALGVSDVVVCGHSHCGAMGGLMSPGSLRDLPLVAEWLEHAQETAARVACSDARAGERVDRAIQENVRVQLEHLMTYPCVREAVQSGRLTLHGWIYRFEHGDVLALDRETDAFAPLVPAEAVARARRRTSQRAGVIRPRHGI